MNLRKAIVAAGTGTMLLGALAGTGFAGATKGGAAGLDCVVYGSDGSYGANPAVCAVSAGKATVNTGAGEAALVYQSTNAVASAALSTLNQLAFSYTGTLSPRLNLNVNQEDYNAGKFDYVFIEGGTCNDGFGNVKPLTNPVCSIVYTQDVTGAASPSTTYPSWAAFIAANPTVALVDNNSNQPYVIQDTPGSGTISNVQLGKPSIPGKKK